MRLVCRFDREPDVPRRVLNYGTELAVWTGGIVGRRVRVTVAVLGGAALVLSGCGEETSGTPEPSTSGESAALWDPCTQISDTVLNQVGVDPSTKESGVAGVEEPGWKVCSWHDTKTQWNYSLGVWSTVSTVDDFKKKQDNTDFLELSVAGRNGFSFRRTTDSDSEDCYLVFSSDSGAIEVSIFNTLSGTSVAPCDRARAAAEVLVPLFPH
ncbi:DUF3558 domain-containing protein [Nocardia sp. NPDC127579]|uniref:DUF3558 domain-containing protein n=1 Tax=Nocardia sp. NPDC127579 TaxID=3345402 RepID=UPI00362E82FF